MSALEYLKKQEWAMGNGQCPDCCGLGKFFTMQYDDKDIGHKLNCKLAESIKELGGEPLYLGNYNSGFAYESYISESGLLGRRVKTENGCPRFKEFNKRLLASIVPNIKRSAQ